MKKYLIMTFCIVTIFLCSSTVIANEYFPNVNNSLPYEYEFSPEFIVAGERVLNLTIKNNTNFNIQAIEFEIRLRNAFKEIISEWNTISNPDFTINSNSSNTLILTLKRQNILGIQTDDGLKNAKYIDLRYKRILLDNDVLIEQRKLYPELEDIYKDYKLDIQLISEYPLIETPKLEITAINDDDLYFNRRANRLSTLKDIFIEFSDKIILLINAKNISTDSSINNWRSTTEPVFTLLDNEDNQYNQYALIYEPQQMGGVVDGDVKLMPGVTTMMVYIFNKNTEFEWIDVYIKNEMFKRLSF